MNTNRVVSVLTRLLTQVTTWKQVGILFCLVLIGLIGYYGYYMKDKIVIKLLRAADDRVEVRDIDAVDKDANYIVNSTSAVAVAVHIFQPKFLPKQFTECISFQTDGKNAVEMSEAHDISDMIPVSVMPEMMISLANTDEYEVDSKENLYTSRLLRMYELDHAYVVGVRYFGVLEGKVTVFTKGEKLTKEEKYIVRRCAERISQSIF